MADRKKVLVVEDDAFTLFMMKEIIATLGVGVDSVSTGEDVCRIMSEAPEAYGLILMDLHMPGMSGIDATRYIRELATSPPNKVPIIAVTADVNYHDDARVEDLGMNGYASKPVSPGQLLSLLDRYCNAA